MIFVRLQKAMSCLPDRSGTEKAASYEANLHDHPAIKPWRTRMTAEAYEHCNGWTKSYTALTARRLLPLSMIILNGRNGLQPIHIWKPVKRRTLFFGG